MLTILAVIAVAIWIVGALVIIWGTQTASEGGYDGWGIALAMAVFWPIWVVLGITSALYEIHRTNKLNQPEKPIDRNTRG